MQDPFHLVLGLEQFLLVDSLHVSYLPSEVFHVFLELGFVLALPDRGVSQFILELAHEVCFMEVILGNFCFKGGDLLLQAFNKQVLLAQDTLHLSPLIDDLADLSLSLLHLKQQLLPLLL
jgi:hypothetical protein